MNYGQIAYEEYVRECGGIHPTWDQLPHQLQMVWLHVGSAIVREYEEDNDIEHEDE